MREQADGVDPRRLGPAGHAALPVPVQQLAPGVQGHFVCKGILSGLVYSCSLPPPGRVPRHCFVCGEEESGGKGGAFLFTAKARCTQCIAATTTQTPSASANPAPPCAVPAQGSLPANWTLPASLLELALSSNQLTGTVPEDWLPDGLQVAPLLRLLLLRIAELRLTDVNQEDLSIMGGSQRLSVACIHNSAWRGRRQSSGSVLYASSHCALPEVG